MYNRETKEKEAEIAAILEEDIEDGGDDKDEDRL